MKKVLKKVLVLAFTLMFTISCTLNDSMFANAISESEENNDNICECGSDHIHDTHDGWIPLNGNVTFNDLESGKYYLTEKCKKIKGQIGTINKKKDITICLNGFNIKGELFIIEPGSKLTLTDCHENLNKGKITYEYDEYDIKPNKDDYLIEHFIRDKIYNRGELNICNVDLEFKLDEYVDKEKQEEYLDGYSKNGIVVSSYPSIVCIYNTNSMNIVNTHIDSDLERIPYYTINSTSIRDDGKSLHIVDSKINSKSRLKDDNKIIKNATKGLFIRHGNIKNSKIISDFNGITGVPFGEGWVPPDDEECLYIDRSEIIGARTGVYADKKIIINDSYISTTKESQYELGAYFLSPQVHSGIYIDKRGGVELKGKTKVKGYDTYGVSNNDGEIKLNDDAEIIGENKLLYKENVELNEGLYENYDLVQGIGQTSFYINNDNIDRIMTEGGKIYLSPNLKKEKIIQRYPIPYNQAIVALDKEKGNRYNGCNIIIDFRWCEEWRFKNNIGRVMVEDVTDYNKNKFKLAERHTKKGYYLSKEPDEKEKGKYNLVLRLLDEDEDKRDEYFSVSYKYENFDEPKELTKDILEILPPMPGNITIKKGSNICPDKMENVKVEDGEWKFMGWSPNNVENIDKNTEFVGRWKFDKNPGGGTVTPKPDPEPKPDPTPTPNPDKPVVPNKPTVPDKEEPDRIEGDDRIETAIEASEKLYPNGTDKVVLANAERFSDVLTANPFAVQEKASALLTYKDKLPEKTLKEIERLGAKKIYVSGGYEAVSKKVVDSLAAKGYEIYRFDGVDRYDTARKIAIKIREKGNTNAIELASGEDFPDALCMTPLAVKDKAPILLTKKDSIPKYTKQALAEWDIENIKIGGLDEAVSKEVEKQIKSGFAIDKNSKKDSNVYDGAKAVKRIGGANRYETSAKLAAESYPESKLGVYATGEDFPDALIAGNYAGRKEAPVLLVKRDSLPEVIEKYTEESKIERATIIGGVNAVSDKVFNLIKYAINR